MRASGRKVAIVAIDPSSPFSGGAILGDRIRMGELAGDPGVFVRSMATRGSLGGLARGTLEAVDVLDASGFDVVLIETVGVGQDEVEVARAAHTTVVVSAPGLGDDIQAIKAGILEIADIHVVSKCDRPDAEPHDCRPQEHARARCRAHRGKPAWQRAGDRDRRPLRGRGLSTELLAAIDRHHAHARPSGDGSPRGATLINERRLLKAGEEILRERVVRHRDDRVSALLAAARPRAS